jgi:hypothetical protein
MAQEPEISDLGDLDEQEAANFLRSAEDGHIEGLDVVYEKPQLLEIQVQAKELLRICFLPQTRKMPSRKVLGHALPKHSLIFCSMKVLWDLRYGYLCLLLI